MHYFNLEIKNRPHKAISQENWKESKGQRFSDTSGDPSNPKFEDPHGDTLPPHTYSVLHHNHQ